MIYQDKMASQQEAGGGNAAANAAGNDDSVDGILRACAQNTQRAAP
jgi:hypothetical protein